MYVQTVFIDVGLPEPVTAHIFHFKEEPDNEAVMSPDKQEAD